MALRSGAETPMLRVSRPVSACSRCRAAKVKCDGKLPACTACEKLGRAGDCTSVTDQFARGKERSYVASLESRVESLERRIAQKSGGPMPVAKVAGSPPVTSPPAKADEIKELVKTSREQQQEDDDIESLVSDFGFLAVNATSRDFYGFTSGMSFSHLILTPATLEVIPDSTMRSLPARHVAQALFQHYLTHQFVLLPFFSETSFFASVNAMYQRQGWDWDHWVVFMVLAIASASRSQRKGDVEHENSLGFVNAALLKADRVLHPGSMSGVQAVLFLTQFALYQPDYFDSWYLIGAASRIMVDLGMHQDRPRQNRDAATELRRRVFYCVYSLDRSISMVLRRAFSFSDDSVDVALPSRQQDPPHPSSLWEAQLQPLDSAFHMFRMRRLQSAWYQELFQAGRSPYPDADARLAKVSREMQSWLETTPACTPAWIRTTFELELAYSQVYVRAPSRRIQDVEQRVNLSTFEYCTSFCQRMRLALQSNASVRFYCAPHEALRVYFMGHRFLDITWNDRDGVLGADPSDAGSASSLRSLSPELTVPGVDHRARSVACVNHVFSVLGVFGARWNRSAEFQKVFKTR
ncbi:MAG: hypothetical protein M1838_003411, partial [Thelocarpon superellum]